MIDMNMLLQPTLINLFLVGSLFAHFIGSTYKKKLTERKEQVEKQKEKNVHNNYTISTNKA